jgi:hypothetical protein
MRNIFTGVFGSMLLITSLGCMNGNNVYIVSKEDSLYKETLKTPKGIMIAPPKPKYGRYTFLIDSNSMVYFYSFQEPQRRTGVSDDEEPELIGLMPNHVFKIPKGLELAFYDENVQKQASKQKTKSVIIGLFKDSTQNNFLQYLLKLSNDKSNNLGLQIRMALPEERSVLKYKCEGKHYDQR